MRIVTEAATEFTPWASLGGGVLIGLAATLLMLLIGRVMGATGILAGLFEQGPRPPGDWRLAVLLGMMTGPWAFRAITGELPQITPVSLPVATVIGGMLVGIGVTFGSGCTSGHGVCGLARMSGRSVVATFVFMATCGATVFLVRHGIGG